MFDILVDENQLEAIEELKTGSILCGGVGSGKSRTALVYFYTKICKGELKINGEGTIKDPFNPTPLYIITTARKRDTFEWDEECSPFMLSRDPKISISGIPVTIDSWNNIGKYIDIKDAFFIFDEQRVVGSGAWVKSFLKIVKNNRWILLSATPGDTWIDYIPVFIANGFYRNKTEFCREHVIYSRFTQYPKVERYINCKKLSYLRNKIVVDMDCKRHTIQHHEDVIVNYNQILYMNTFKNHWDPFKQEPIKDAGALCYVLRRVVNDDLNRFITAEDLIAKHSRVIIFYNFDYELELLRTLKEQMNIEVAEWNGHKHEPVPKGDRWAYLVQYTAGAEGWNCTETDTVIFYSQNYSYKVMCQAAGRIDRRNTPYIDLYYYHLRSNAKIDLAIKRALSNKKNFNESRFLNIRKFA